MISKLPNSSKFCNKSLFDPLKKIILEITDTQICQNDFYKKCRDSLLFQTTVTDKNNQTVTNKFTVPSIIFRLTNTEYLALNPHLTPPIFGSNYAVDVSSTCSAF